MYLYIVPDDDEKCSICLGTHDTEEIVLPCKHRYHTDCINHWLETVSVSMTASVSATHIHLMYAILV